MSFKRVLAVRNAGKVPLAFEAGVVTVLPQEVSDCRDIAAQFANPREIRVIPQSGVLRVHAGPHGSARGCTNRDGTVMPVKGDTSRL